MSIRIGVNGFGRIGKLVTRAAFEKNSGFKIVAINNPGMTVDYLIYQLKYDTAHGTFAHNIEKVDEENIRIDGQNVRFTQELRPQDIKWGDFGADIICESSGVFLTQEKVQGHLQSGAKKVIMSAPAKDNTPTYVVGVNHNQYQASQNVVSNASCTTNCLAPLAYVIQKEFGILEGLMTTVHAATATQEVVDASSRKDWRAGRAASANIIPSTTGAAKAVGLVLPELKGKLTGMAFRVPTINVSVVDLTVRLNKGVSYENLCATVKNASENEMKGILGYTDEKLVSSDFNHEAQSSVFDSKAGIGLSDNFHKLITWYDNEWGYSNRILDLAAHVHKVSGL